MTRALFFVDAPHRMAGAQRSLLAAVLAARGSGLDPVMVCPGEGVFVEACRASQLPAQILEGGAAFHTFGKALLHSSWLAQLRIVLSEILPYATRLARLIDAERMEVVHFNTARGAIMAGMGAHVSGREVVLHVRGTPAIGATLWAGAQAISGTFILVAAALEQYLSSSARNRSRVVYNGVALPPERTPTEVRDAAARAGVPAAWIGGGAPLLVSLSSLVPFKGLHHLLRAFRVLTDRGLEARLVLAGTGVGDAYETWLRQLAAELRLEDRVRFLGFVSDPAPLLAASDVLVLPSVQRERLNIGGRSVDVHGNEGLPRSVLEAMAAAVPVVASDIAGVREQLDAGTTGLIVPPGDPAALGDALIQLVSNTALRRSMGRAAREVVRERFTVESAGRGLLDVLTSASIGRPRIRRARDAFDVFRDALLRGRQAAISDF